MNAMDGIAGLLVTVISSVVMGIAFLLCLYKTIDGDIPLIPGMIAMGVSIGLLLMSVKPINPIIPAVILVTVLTVMALFPYASTQLEEAELRSVDTERLEKAYASLQARPDNISSIFEVARRLHAHGMTGHAIGLSKKTLDALSGQVDQVSNRSFRDQFRSEEYEMKRWMKLAVANPKIARPVACPHCGTVNSLDLIVCAKCNEAYVITLARSLDIRPRFIGKLVMAAAAVAALIVGAAAIGATLGGMALYVSFIGAIAGTGLFIHWLFRTPQIAR
jgi:hypothetical protein